MTTARNRLGTPFLAIAAGLAFALSGCGAKEKLQSLVFEKPETAVAYEVEMNGSPSSDVTDLAEQSLDSYRMKDKGAASLAFLRRRAESDVPTLLKILRSRGHYTSKAEVKVEETAPGEAKVTFTVDPGPAFKLVRHTFKVVDSGGAETPALDAKALGSPIGGQALAASIAKAEGEAVAELRHNGFPYAAYKSRSGVADPENATLEVTSVIDAGPKVTFGPVSFVGVKTVDEAYLRTYQPWKEGDVFNTEKLREFQRKLFGTDLFASASVNPPENPPKGAAPGAPLPVTVKVEEGKPRRISGSIRYDTDLGPTVRAAFEHRNLFGANERLLIQGDASIDEQTAGIGLKKPQFLRPGQDFLTHLTFTHSTLDAYDETTAEVFAGLERGLGGHWRGGLGVSGELSEIIDAGNTETASLAGLPGFVSYDGSNDVFNPTRGARLKVEATPFGGIYGDQLANFLVVDAHGSYYYPIDEKAQYVVAVRGRVGSILSENIDGVPPTHRLYSGGGGSVRGYRQDYIGPLDADNKPVGGRSVVEAGAEFRARVWGDFGAAAFGEAGTVSTAMFPDFSEDVQFAAGVGLRYFSPAGPIRIDVAFPLNPRPVDDPFQIYFAVGQAF